MASPFLRILANATVVSSCGILVTLLLRKQFRMLFGPSLTYFLWLLVPTSLLVLLLPAPSTGSKTVLAVPLSIPSLTSHVAQVSMSSGLDWRIWLLCTWGIGALLFCWRLARQQRQFITSLGMMSGADNGVLRAANSTGCPAVVGILRPKIIVPGDFDTRYAPEERTLILAHERMHVRRGDLVVNATCALARCIFWFNPLIHVVEQIIRFDQELACDAAVMRNHPHSRKPYATAMLRTQLADGALPLGCHWSSTHPLKERIMVLKQPPARGLRRLIGQALVGICVVLVGYGSWAAQSPTGAAARMTYADSEIRIFSDSVQASEHGVRYTGSVILKIVGRKGTFKYDADNMSVLEGDTTVEGEATSDGRPSGDASVSHRKRVLLVGNVRIEVDGRIFTTERALILSRGVFKMDEVEVLQKTSSEDSSVR